MQAEIDAAVLRVARSGWFVLGAELEAFEHEFATYCGAAECVGVGNGLEAIQLLLRAHGIGPGDDVVVPAFTFVATWLGVSAAGARPAPVPCLEATANLDPDRVEEALTPATKAILAVHLYGQPAQMDALRDVARRNDLLLLEDAAQAHGAAWQGRRAGALGDGAAFSFYPTKNLGAIGDAGAVVCDDPAVADRVRLLRNYGSPRKYVHELPGVNSRLDEVHAAVLRAKLERLDDWNDRRRRTAERYLAELRGVQLPEVAAGADPCWHLFVVRSAARKALADHLADNGVGTLIHYPEAPHQTGAYRDLDVRADHVESAASLAARVLSLPVGPQLAADQVDRVIAAVNSCPDR